MKVYIGVPQHGSSINAETYRSLNAATKGSRHEVTCQSLGLSLLARNFNTLWIQAYRSGADFFILHHSDLGVMYPSGGNWVDLLVRRMYQLNAASLSVASPIKSEYGHFSMGLDMKAGNPYTLRRLTAKELFCLPEPFIARCDLCSMFGLHPDAAGAMIVNTGLLIMDLRRFDWFGMRWPGFNIVDEIAWSTDGVPQAFTEPEDWYYSRWLHDRGLPFFATKELMLRHHGGQVFTNRGLWGVPIDDTPKQSSVKEWTSHLAGELL